MLEVRSFAIFMLDCPSLQGPCTEIAERRGGKGRDYKTPWFPRTELHAPCAGWHQLIKQLCSSLLAGQHTRGFSSAHLTQHCCVGQRMVAAVQPSTGVGQPTITTVQLS